MLEYPPHKLCYLVSSLEWRKLFIFAIIQVCIGLAMKSLRHEQLDLRVKAMIGEGEVKKRRSSSVSQGYLLALSSGECDSLVLLYMYGGT